MKDEAACQQSRITARRLKRGSSAPAPCQADLAAGRIVVRSNLLQARNPRSHEHDTMFHNAFDIDIDPSSENIDLNDRCHLIAY
eukprot:3029847-Pleurochrysis_carterae.AAC.3